MAKKENPNHPKRTAVPDLMPKPDPWSLKDNPDGETVCSPYFSRGCINEDTDSPTVILKEKQKNEKR